MPDNSEPPEDVNDDDFTDDEDGFEDTDDEIGPAKPENIRDLLAAARSAYEMANPSCSEDDIPLVRTDEICTRLSIDVPTFHNLKSKLHRMMAGDIVTVVGRYLPGSGGWGWKLSGNGAGAVSRYYAIARQRNLLGRLRVSHAITQSQVALVDTGATLIPGDQAADQAIKNRIRDQEFDGRRLVESAERLLAALEA